VAAEELSSKALWSAQNRSIEADLRSDLAQVLVPFVLGEVGLPPEAIRQEGTGRAGRFDSMFGEAILEYKRPQLLRSRREREAAAVQALEYLDDATLGARVVLITDGEVWGILRDIEAQQGVGEQITLDFGEPALIPPIARFAWRDTSVETARAVLDLLASLKAAPVDSRNLIAFLGPSRAEVLELLAQLATVLGDRELEGRTDVLFNQWIQSAGVAYGIRDVDAPWPRRPRRERMLESLHAVFAQRTYPETVYALHTYIALAAKLVAAEVLAIQTQHPEWRPSQWAHLDDASLVHRLRRLESGELSEQLGAPGLLASDLFDWYAYEAGRSAELLLLIRSVLNLFSQLAWARVATAGGMKIDLLRDLYQSVVPRRLRKSLGEFFTPRWLAERVFANALSLMDARDGAETDGQSLPRVLDPACGSGTFLVAAMRTGLLKLDLQERGEDEAALEELANSVIGFDINPVSALMSRVNLLLVLGDRAQVMPEVAFHVYQADSIVLPRVRSGQLELGANDEGEGDLGDFIDIPTAIADFRVARALLTPVRMAILRRNLEVALRGRVSEALFITALEADLKREGGIVDEQLPVIRETGTGLFEQLVRLRDEERDDVWARVLEQFVAPYLLDPVDLVVGNPPWVSWKDLPDGWKERSEPIWRSWGLWKTRARQQGAPLSDISTLMLARAIVSYARDGGMVAMLLPQSVVLADPGGNAFRRSDLRPEPGDRVAATEETDIPFRVLAIDDFASVNPFAPDAANLTIALYIRSRTEPVFPIPACLWRRVPRARLRPEWSWIRATESLTGQEASIEPVDPADVTSPWGLSPAEGSLPLLAASREVPYALGRGYETRGLDGLFTFNLLTNVPSGPRREVRIRNDPDAGDNTAGEEAREGVVEADLLWPLVKGEDVTRWSVASTDRYWFVPYAVTSEGATALTQAAIAQRYPRFFRYLQPWVGRYLDRSMYQAENDEAFPWALSGPIDHLRADGALLFVRYIGQPIAAVREPQFDARLDRTTLPLPNNKSNIYYTSSTDEAHFLAAFINSTPAQRALGRFAVLTGVTPAALARLPMPAFSGEIEEHVELARLGRAAANQAGDADELAELEVRIDAVVWRIVGDGS
jgi:hypothetical protein